MTTAKLLVPAGGSSHLSAGDLFAPSQLYCSGIGWPSWNASLVRLSLARVAFSTAVPPFVSFDGCLLAPQLARAMSASAGASLTMVDCFIGSLRRAMETHEPGSRCV